MWCVCINLPPGRSGIRCMWPSPDDKRSEKTHKLGKLSIVMMRCTCSFACLLPGTAYQQVTSYGLLYNIINP